jgi:hypothetical protein
MPRIFLAMTKLIRGFERYHSLRLMLLSLRPKGRALGLVVARDRFVDAVHLPRDDKTCS